MKITNIYLREANIPELKVGDIVLVGKWRNSPVTIKSFGRDKNNQPTILTNRGEYSLYKFRIQKLMKRKK